jgi:3-oxoacyl-[acyl-carrier-protein] synthase-3
MCGFAEQPVASYDYFIFHQANEYLIKFICSKTGIDINKVPIFLRNYGNTSAASVPLTFTLAGFPRENKDEYSVMFLGFGVGLSWGAVSMCISRDCRLDHFEYAPDRRLTESA